MSFDSHEWQILHTVFLRLNSTMDYPPTLRCASRHSDLWHELAWGAMEGPAVYCFLQHRIPGGSLRYSGSWQRLKESGSSEAREEWGSQYVHCPQSINSAGKSVMSALLESRHQRGNTAS